MKKNTALVLILCFVTFCSQAQKWQKLFDGKSLNGWHVIPGGSWEVKKRTIVGMADAEDKRHGLLITDKVYKDFTVSVTYKSVKGNSGLYFRVDEVGGEVGVHGFQAEIDPNKDTGGLYETGGRAWVIQPDPEDVKKWYKPNQWNTLTVTARGKDIIVYVNGIKSAELKNDPGRTEGHIALQLHGNMDMEVIFKEIKIMEY
jgi:hypothetical protein